MRISDWSSDVCSSDLNREDETRLKLTINLEVAEVKAVTERGVNKEELVGKKHNESFYIVTAKAEEGNGLIRDRKSVVEGKSVSVRVDLGGRRIIKKKKTKRRETGRTSTEKKKK